jgi:hypothetical protein
VAGGYVYDPMYGLIRRAVLQQAGPMRQHPDADRVLIAELALLGRFHQVSLPLFLRRTRGGRSPSLAQYETLEAYAAWYAPGSSLTPAPKYTGLLSGYAAVLGRVALPWSEWPGGCGTCCAGR